ncbi:MAG: putative RNA uridine N3 methyltransferase, partial [Halobacteriota archaeon]
FGEELTVGRLETLAGRVDRDGMTVAFGAPERGLPDILGIDEAAVGATDAQATAADDAEFTSGEAPVEPTAGGFDLWLNTVPYQGSEVVRTEEALFATLAPLSLRA